MDASLDLTGLIDSSQYVTLAGSKLYDHFAPTRDRTEGTKSVFTYKSMLQDPPSAGIYRETLDKYVVTAFGEMDFIEVNPTSSIFHVADENKLKYQGKNPARLRLRCPSSLKCSIKAVYGDQIKTLREPIDHDLSTSGGVVYQTWFGDTNEANNGDMEKIYVNLETKREYESDFGRDFAEGQVVVLWASLKRTDQDIAGCIYRTYSLHSDYYTPASIPENVKKGSGYECDRNVGECEFCY
ncbi:hypothetical protein DFH06DRAFT_1328206 [Mycena polygramma]|nr:hypothetical protein DFH06DRAFT_1337248 [Mycena polygramma]KAJ7657396.1 hypothetical protein DFH06DRAFT_1328206 [Mycena polygramma]